MPLDKDDIEHLLQERAWYKERQEQVIAGTYSVERREFGAVVDDREETAIRFADIIHAIEEILTIEKVKFDA